MKTSNQRILTTHGGALRRPDDLMTMIVAQSAHPSDDTAALDARVKSATREAVAAQAANGIDIVNDGEFPKISWMGYYLSRLGGIEKRPAPAKFESPILGRDSAMFPGWWALAARAGGPMYSPMLRIDAPPPAIPTEISVCAGPLTYTGMAAVASDIANLKAAAAGQGVEDLFISAIGPSMLEWALPNRHYATDEDYVFAIADAMRHEYKAITDAGIVVQLDEPTFATNWGLTGFDEMSVAEYRKWLEVRVEAMNHALRGIDPDLVRLHFCWGSWHAPHASDIPLRDILDLALRVKATGISFEASNPRHEHEWSVWQDIKLPDDKVMIPGVIGHFSDYIEHPDLVAQRIIRYADLVGRERVIAGTDCGIGSRVGHPEVCWAKFRTLAEGARIATDHLWRR
jgi:5-methyltetrahydropteroyltriglutamate--homocysteine methyltransferase